MGFSAVIILAQIVTAVPVGVAFGVAVYVTQPESVAQATLGTLATNGLFLSLTVLVTTPPCVGLTFLFAWLRRRQIPVRRYLGLGAASARRTAVWLGATVLFAGAATALALVMPDPVASNFMVKVYETSVFPPLMVVAFVVAAPLFEELLFRGFLFEGIRRSRLGAAGAVVVSSVAWAVIHFQYGWISIALLLALGFLLSAARLRTGSVWVCFLMHAVFNLMAVVETMVAAHA